MRDSERDALPNPRQSPYQWCALTGLATAAAWDGAATQARSTRRVKAERRRRALPVYQEVGGAAHALLGRRH